MYFSCGEYRFPSIFFPCHHYLFRAKIHYCVMVLGLFGSAASFLFTVVIVRLPSHGKCPYPLGRTSILGN